MMLPAYHERKLTGYPFLPSVPDAWTVAKLRNAVESLASGGTPDTSDERYWSDSGTGLPWVSIGDMSRERIIRTTEKNITELGRATRRLDIFPPGTLLLSMYASLGKTAVLGVPATVNQAILAIRPGSNSTTSFLKWWFEFLQPHIEQFSSANTQANLSAARVAALPICLPSLTEQASIAAFLARETAKIDALDSEQERLIALLQEKRQAVISHAVTKGLNPDVPFKNSGVEWIGSMPSHWTLPPVADRYSVELGKMLDEKRIKGDHPTRYLRNINVQWDSVQTDDLPQMDIAPHEADRYLVRAGDLLVCEGGEVGRGAIWDGRIAPCGYQKALHRLRPRRESEVPRFMLYTLRHAVSTGVFTANGNQNTIPHLTAQQLRRYRFPTPPALEQRLIVDQLDRATEALDSAESAAQLAIALLSERRNALITAAVTGQIDVRGLIESAA